MEAKISRKANVEFVGEFKPSPFRFRKTEEWKPGKTPAQM
jgi:hypothetical protein